MKKKHLVILAAAALLLTAAGAGAQEYPQSLINPADAAVKVQLESEVGFLGLLYHTIASGPDKASADTFNYITKGGQDILFPFSRYTVTAQFGKRHHLRLLYQPLRIETQSDLQSSYSIGDETFGPGPVDITYGFPFWRIGYSYDFIYGQRWRIGAGGALQLRNASILFASGDGTALNVGQNLGPVPALKLEARYDHPAGWFAGFEAVGIYASSAFINGADYDFEGSLLDASVRTGLKLRRGMETFINLRFLGGSARGTSESADDTNTSGSAYTANYLAAYSVSLGLTLR